jgi:hypothetical protein
VVAFETDDLLGLRQSLQIQDVIHHPLGVRPPVDVISHKDQLVPGQVRLDLFQETLQQVQISVNVADGVNVCGHIQPLPNRGLGERAGPLALALPPKKIF